MIYDPLGFLANFLMFLKVLLQEIWRSGIGWDDTVSDHHHNKWKTWLSVLNSLQAAVIGTRLAKDIEASHRVQIKKRFFWSDSRDVLCWIRSDHRKYTKYVGARVGEILESSVINEWNWVPTKLNVADEATKWQKIQDFSPCSRWFKGPEFIWKLREEWPEQSSCIEPTTNEQVQSVNVHSIDEPFLTPFYYGISDWRKLVRLAAFVLRYIANIKATLKELPLSVGIVTQSEMLKAENFIYRHVQLEVFPHEIQLLSQNKDSLLPKKSLLYKLSPFLDENGLLRMRGRITACEFIDPFTAHPILLPREHIVTELIVNSVHNRYHHLNHETVVNELRQLYHIPKLRRVCDKVRRNCQTCKNAMAKPNPPFMADLPPARLAAYCRPFSYSGIDYFGPLQVVVGRRVEKRWGVLITCLVVRAVHVEIAHTLTSSSCIMALQNFIARRGAPLEIFSDRGTNFVGANRELNEALGKLDQDKIIQEIVSSKIKWSFLLPCSPHMGGSWERLPTDEVLRNALSEIELIINSRPLTYLPIENADTEALTPNHFLVGSSSGSKPIVPYDDSSALLKNTWKTSQLIANYFWKRWLREYLPTITRRTKWFYPVKPIKVGDIVVITDPELPRNVWPKGRVIKVHNRDGQVRSATVKTAFSIYDRPAARLAVLDVGAT
ncbi:uncharacterized protein LOC129759421 [Uranotaenia lowii]|uniref:uncharacterized protein LOC129759421 n=1 Tax=Uranotaenia lowii TaxID=190385 RepID=UPI00247B0035|nr:uncharacterized protein LOC129759421 [Uranotaenia lowii]